MTRMPGRTSFALAAVLASATVARAASEENNVAQSNAEEVAQDNQALDQLRSAGSDPSKPHQIEFYL